MIRHLCRAGLLLTLIHQVHAQSPGGSCAGQARTELEQAYCKILAANPNVALPSLQELRRNPEKTQRLLLRRPAAQAGIELPPEPAARPSAKPQPQTPPPAPKASASAPAAKPAPRASVSDGALSHCQLAGTSISCGSDLFRLQGNMPNGRLAQGALDPERKIHFAEFTGDTADTAQVMSYLSTTYQRYLESMLEIGLGAATMSFTKFHHTFMEAQSRGTRFGERLSTMFDFLKKDKATMGVQAHYNNELPQSLEQCMAFGTRLLVCDNVQQNWVYQRAAL
jgi:hypothetical protein